MKRFLALLALLSLALALPAAAPAKKKHKPHHRTTVLKGSFEAIGADGAYTDKKFGKAHLVDNRKRDKLSVHLRRLAPRTAYTFALYSVAKGEPRCEEGASGGTQETAFPPKTKSTNARGHLNAKQRSKTFKVDRARRYFVLVSQGAAPVACAKLKGKKKGKPRCRRGHGEKGKGHGKARREARGKARSKARGEARREAGGKAEGKPRGEARREAGGKAEGKARGKGKAGAAKRGCKRRGR
jgi:hypothetical protein